MLISFNRRGGTTDSRKSSGGKAVRDYLLGKNNDRKYARVLKGEPEVTTEVINGLQFAKIYTSGVLAFDYGEGDKLSDKQKLEIIESFEIALFPNLEVNQYTGYWVEHTDKTLLDEKTNKPILDNEGKEQRRLELNFVFASVELMSGKALPVYYHKNDMNLIDSWRDVINAIYELADPNDLKRKRTLTTVKDLPKSSSDIRKSIHDLIDFKIEQGEVKSRKDVLRVFDSLDLEVVREGKKFISIRNPDGKNNIRFKGEVYEQQFKVEELSRTHSPSKRAEPCQNSIDIATARERYTKCVKQRCVNLGRRFETRDDQREQLQRFSGTKPSPFNFKTNKNIADNNSDFIPHRRYVADKRSVVSTMEIPRHITFDDNSITDRNILSNSSLGDEKQKELDKAVGVYIDINTDEYNRVKSDWSNNGSTETFATNEAIAKFDSRQLDIIKNIEELHLFSSEERVREVLAKPENNSIVALLVEPLVEREQYEIQQLARESNNVSVITQEAEASLNPKSIIESPVLESQYPKYTP